MARPLGLPVEASAIASTASLAPQARGPACLRLYGHGSALLWALFHSTSRALAGVGLEAAGDWALGVRAPSSPLGPQQGPVMRSRCSATSLRAAAGICCSLAG